jgi:hypothetical protein
LVRDGNHCVNIARLHGVEAIEAEVVVRGSPRPQTWAPT